MSKRALSLINWLIQKRSFVIISKKVNSEAKNSLGFKRGRVEALRCHLSRARRYSNRASRDGETRAQ